MIRFELTRVPVVMINAYTVYIFEVSLNGAERSDSQEVSDHFELG